MYWTNVGHFFVLYIFILLPLYRTGLILAESDSRENEEGSFFIRPRRNVADEDVTEADSKSLEDKKILDAGNVTKNENTESFQEDEIRIKTENDTSGTVDDEIQKENDNNSSLKINAKLLDEKPQTDKTEESKTGAKDEINYRNININESNISTDTYNVTESVPTTNSTSKDTTNDSSKLPIDVKKESVPKDIESETSKELLNDNSTSPIQIKEKSNISSENNTINSDLLPIYNNVTGEDLGNFQNITKGVNNAEAIEDGDLNKEKNIETAKDKNNTSTDESGSKSSSLIGIKKEDQNNTLAERTLSDTTDNDTSLNEGKLLLTPDIKIEDNSSKNVSQETVNSVSNITNEPIEIGILGKGIDNSINNSSVNNNSSSQDQAKDNTPNSKENNVEDQKDILTGRGMNIADKLKLKIDNDNDEELEDIEDYSLQNNDLPSNVTNSTHTDSSLGGLVYDDISEELEPEMLVESNDDRSGDSEKKEGLDEWSSRSFPIPENYFLNHKALVNDNKHEKTIVIQPNDRKVKITLNIDWDGDNSEEVPTNEENLVSLEKGDVYDLIEKEPKQYFNYGDNSTPHLTPSNKMEERKIKNGYNDENEKPRKYTNSFPKEEHSMNSSNEENSVRNPVTYYLEYDDYEYDNEDNNKDVTKGKSKSDNLSPSNKSSEKEDSLNSITKLDEQLDGHTDKNNLEKDEINPSVENSSIFALNEDNPGTSKNSPVSTSSLSNNRIPFKIDQVLSEHKMPINMTFQEDHLQNTKGVSNKMNGIEMSKEPANRLSDDHTLNKNQNIKIPGIAGINGDLLEFSQRHLFHPTHKNYHISSPSNVFFHKGKNTVTPIPYLQVDHDIRNKFQPPILNPNYSKHVPLKGAAYNSAPYSPLYSLNDNNYDDINIGSYNNLHTNDHLIHLNHLLYNDIIKDDNGNFPYKVPASLDSEFFGKGLPEEPYKIYVNSDQQPTYTHTFAGSYGPIDSFNDVYNFNQNVNNEPVGNLDNFVWFLPNNNYFKHKK